MIVLAIDPGNGESAWVLFDGARLLLSGKQPNDDVLQLVTNGTCWTFSDREMPEPDILAIEMIASYGMPVGREVFETCVWIGRFVEAWTRSNCEGGGEHPALVYRRDVKLHLCGSSRAKDANVRQELLDRWGGKDKAVGTKKQPGPLYGVKADIWAALAVAVTFADTRSDCPPPHRQPDPSHSAGEA